MSEASNSIIQKSDRRRYPRKVCQLYDETNRVLVHDISTGGLGFCSRQDFSTKQELAFHLQIPILGNIRPKGRIVQKRAQAAPDFFYGVEFAELASSDRRILKNYLLNRIKKDELGLLQNQFLSSADHVVSLTDISEMMALLKSAKDARVSLLLFQEDFLSHYHEARLSQVSDHLIEFDVFGERGERGQQGKGQSDFVSYEKPFSVYFDYSFHGYFFQSRLHSTPEGKIILHLPERILYSDKRHDVRKLVKGHIVFPVPYPQGSEFQGELFDLSSQGASFLIPQPGWYFLPGTPLRDLLIHTESGVKKFDQAEVRYIQPHREGVLRVGIELSSHRRNLLPVESQSLERNKTWLSSVGQLWQNVKTKSKIILEKKLEKSRKDFVFQKSSQVVHYKNQKGQTIVGLVNASFDFHKEKIKTPVVVIPPAYGKRKESTLGLALTLVEHFRKNSQPIVVIRFDFTNALGESEKDQSSRDEGRHNVNLSPVSGMNDILATLDYLQRLLGAQVSETILMSFSYTSPMARRAVIKSPRVSYWINVNGTPHMQELIKNASGGVDYVGNVAKGLETGLINFLGELLDGTHFCRDAIGEKMAFLPEARQDLSSIKIPVTWIYGKYDQWVNPETIRDVMSVKSLAPRDVIEVPTGHLPTTTEEAFGNFRLLTKLVWRFLFKQEVSVQNPDMASVVRIMDWERGRLPSAQARSQAWSVGEDKVYWKNYLLGDGQKDLGIDVLALTDDYQEMMKDQIDLLNIQNNETVLDLGCGTGNFLVGLAKHPVLSTLENNKIVIKIIMADFIPEALNKAMSKAAPLKQKQKIEILPTPLNLELSSLCVIKRFLSGEYYKLSELKGKVMGIPDSVLNEWDEKNDPYFFQILRGKNISDEDRKYLEAKLPEDQIDYCLDFNRAVKTMRAFLETPQNKSLGDLFDQPFSKMVFPKNTIESFHYPFQTGSMDKILMSIVLSYVYHPQEVLHEAYRMLKPGGKIVLSSFRPDADMTMSYARTIQKIEKMKESPVPGFTPQQLVESIRCYANSAALLLRYGEEGLFKLFSEEELKKMLLLAGFRDIIVKKTFGNPAQVIICVGTKLDESTQIKNFSQALH